MKHKNAPWLDERLAPNGCPIRENFAKWFAASKAIRDGLPLVVYHGTSGDFAEFDPTKVGSRHVDVESGTAFFFSDDPKTADYYAKSAGKQSKGGAHVRPVFLSLQNPLISDFQGEGLEYLAEDIEKAKLNGNDGLIALNYNDGRISTHYIAFHPDQIKSAIGDNGNYEVAIAPANTARAPQERPAPWLDDSLAPNGRPVRENFAAFFGKSKLVDASRAPLRVYHGTKGAFTAFRTPAWFSPSYDMANFFSEAPDEDRNGRTDASKVIEVYLRIENPVHTDDWDVTEPNAAMLRQFKKWQKQGHDGIIFTSEEGEVEYIVFSPEQIKSATINNGNYDLANPCVAETGAPAPVAKTKALTP